MLGKFFTVMLFSCTTALLNLASMGLTGKQIFGRMPSGALSGAAGIAFPPLSALFWIVAPAPAAGGVVQRPVPGAGDVRPQQQGRAVLPDAALDGDAGADDASACRRASS